jgi:hypothetical protein
MSLKTRIFWTEAQNKLVANEIFNVYGCGPYSMSLSSMVRSVQGSVLPAELVRHINSEKAVSKFKKVFDEALAERGGSSASDKVPEEFKALEEEEIGPLPETKAPEVCLSIPNPTPQEAVSLAGIKDALSTAIADVLVEAMRKVFTHPDVAAALSQFHLGQMPTVVREEAPRARHSPEQSQTDKKAKRVVLLCGFKPHQQHQFLQAFPDLHLKFWFSDRPGAGLETLREKARSADTVLCTMEATSHAAVQVVQSTGARLVRVTGGASSMMAALVTEVARSAQHG